MKPRVLALTAVVFWSTAASAFKLTLRWLTPFQLVLQGMVKRSNYLSLDYEFRRKLSPRKARRLSKMGQY
ncbi:MAG: hypothetical protein GQ565_05230 [Candidatus Aegiribacteria sp.]|nr:hypothetical protein [Candidatus Aegiribacteria sp.]